MSKLDRKTSVLEYRFNKVDAALLKRGYKKVLFCQICEIFKNTYFEEHQRTTASKNFIRTYLHKHIWKHFEKA